jgi:hypothetical protein
MVWPASHLVPVTLAFSPSAELKHGFVVCIPGWFRPKSIGLLPDLPSAL